MNLTGATVKTYETGDNPAFSSSFSSAPKRTENTILSPLPLSFALIFCSNRPSLPGRFGRMIRATD
jgi:hypothetical protein